MKQQLYMAPILGITNCTYRNVYSYMFKGYDYAMTPFISACNVESVNSRVLRDLFHERNTVGFELIPQILSKDPKGFISVARAIAELGYKTVNWNLGCPHKKVRNKMRGSGLLDHPQMVVEFLEEVIAALSIKVSIKVRLGTDDDQQLYKLLPMLDKLAIQDITIHPRTAKQMYGGKADLDAFKKALSLTKHTVIYNGDIFAGEQFEILTKRFPSIDKWMIGRGGIINPFLPEEIKNIGICSKEEKLIRFKSFHDQIFLAYQKELDGPAHLLGKMKEHWAYWSRAFNSEKKVLVSVAKTKTIPRYSSLIEEIFTLKQFIL